MYCALRLINIELIAKKAMSSSCLNKAYLTHNFSQWGTRVYHTAPQHCSGLAAILNSKIMNKKHHQNEISISPQRSRKKDTCLQCVSWDKKAECHFLPVHIGLLKFFATVHVNKWWWEKLEYWFRLQINFSKWIHKYTILKQWWLQLAACLLVVCQEPRYLVGKIRPVTVRTTNWQTDQSPYQIYNGASYLPSTHDVACTVLVP